jgi:polyisoprenoid-binding protein YceI
MSWIRLSVGDSFGPSINNSTCVIMKKKLSFENSPAKAAMGIGTLAVILLLVISGSLRAQDAYRAADPDIKVLGTSNLHDWSMEVKDVSCSAKFTFGSAAVSAPQSLTALDITIPVHSLKSGESLLDSRAYTAMKADKFATITYSSASSVIVPGQNGQFQIRSTGNLTISGATQSVVLTASCRTNPDGSIACSGSQQIKMTDYQIKPPSFMFGALKTGDALTINFSLTLKK